MVSSLSVELWEGIGAVNSKNNNITLIAHSSFWIIWRERNRRILEVHVSNFSRIHDL